MQNQFAPVLLAVPHLQRSEPGECLAACAAMVLAHLKIRINYNRLLRILRVQKSYGAPFPNLRRLAELGTTVIYQQGALAELYTFLRSGNPVIVPVKTQDLPYWNENIDHAIVVVGMDSQFVYLNDPAFAAAPLQVLQGDFELAWIERDEYYAVLLP